MTSVTLIVRAMMLQQDRMRLAVERWIRSVHLGCDGQTKALRPDGIEQSVARVLDPGVGVQPDDDLVSWKVFWQDRLGGHCAQHRRHPMPVGKVEFPVRDDDLRTVPFQPIDLICGQADIENSNVAMRQLAERSDASEPVLEQREIGGIRRTYHYELSHRGFLRAESNALTIR